MSKESGILLLGIIVALAQFLGFPSSWENAIFFLCGSAIAVLAFILRRGRSLNLFSPAGEHRSDVFAQNGIPGGLPR